MMLIRSRTVLRYLKIMEGCQDRHQNNFQKVSLCTIENFCPNEYSKFFDCKSKNNDNECFNDQVDLDKCMKIPINQMLNILHKAKSY